MTTKKKDRPIEFTGTIRRKITSKARGIERSVFATAVWIRIGGLVSVAAHYHEIACNGSGGGIAMSLVHGRLGGLLYNSTNGQAVQVRAIMGDDTLHYHSKEDEWTEAAIRYAFAALEDILAAPYRLKGDTTKRHPWLTPEV